MLVPIRKVLCGTFNQRMEETNEERGLSALLLPPCGMQLITHHVAGSPVSVMCFFISICVGVCKINTYCVLGEDNGYLGKDKGDSDAGFFAL